MKKITTLLLAIFVFIATVTPAFAAGGDKSEPIVRIDPVLTDDIFEQKVSGNLFMNANSPRVRVGKNVVQIDEKNDEVTPRLVGNTYMLPADFLGKALGAEYSGDINSAVIKYNECSIEFKAENKECLINGESNELSDAPITLYEHLYVPLRKVCESFGKKVNWDKCGIIIAGDSADSFSWDTKEGYDILLRASRDVLYINPSPDDVTTRLKEKNPDNLHPRLLVRADEVTELRNKVNNAEPYKTWFKSVKNKADIYLTYSEEKMNVNYVFEDGIRLLYVSRRASEYMETLSFAYLMTGDKRYADKAISVLMKVCKDEFPDWHPYHFLDVAEMAAGVALCYDWCYDALRPSQRWIAKNAIVEKALKPVMEDYNEIPGRQRTWYWSSRTSESYPQNWISVSFGGTTMAALAVGDEDLGDFKDVGRVITEGMERQKDLYETYMPDGSFVDGPGYWELAMSYLVYGISSMQTAIGTDYSMLNCPGIINTYDWLAQVMGPDGGFNYDSNNPSFTNSPEYFWMSNAINKPNLTDYRLNTQINKWKLETSFKDIIWYKPNESNEEFMLDNTYYSRGGVVMSVMRSGFNDMDTWVSMFGSYMDKQEASHDFDGTFVLDMLGKRWGLDLGSESGTYGSSGTPIYEYYRARAEGSNTVIIQPGYGADHDHKARAQQEKFETNVFSSYVIYDLTQQLEYKGAKSWRRGMKLDKMDNTVVIEDELSTSKSSEYYWFMHTEADIKVSDDGRSAVLSRDNRKIMAKLISNDKKLKFEVMDAVPLKTSPNPSHQDKNDGVTKLTVHALDVTDVKMAVKFIPLYGKEIDKTDEEYINLDNWKLEYSSNFDRSLKLSGLSIDNVPIDYFSPDVRNYSIELGLSGVSAPPVVSATSENGIVSYVAPTEDNYVGKIVVTDKYNKERKNEYYVDFYLKDFSDAMITMVTPDIYATGAKPKELNKIDVQSVTASSIPQPQNPPEGMLDDNLSTRYSVQGLGTTVDFDLGSVQTVTHIGTAVYDGDERGMMYVLACSDDGENWTEVISVKTGGTTNDEEYYKIPETTARYFRIYCCGNTASGSTDDAWFSVSEMGFYN